MPLINYVCDCGEVQKKYLKSAKDALPTAKCKCGLEAKKSFGNTSSSRKITIDNGLMSRAIHVDENIMEINDQRSDLDLTKD